MGVIFHPVAAVLLLLLIIATSIAFNGMMFLMMVRGEDPLVLRAIAVADPFTYAVHGLKSILLKDGGFVAIRMDLLFLFTFGFATLLIATPLFKRSP